MNDSPQNGEVATRHGAYTVMLCLVPDGLRGEGRHVGTWGCATGVQYACVGFFWTINLCSQDNRLRADSTASVSVSLSLDGVRRQWGSLVQGAAASLRIHTHAHRATNGSAWTGHSIYKLPHNIGSMNAYLY